MKVSGRTLGEHLRLLRSLLILIALVWLLRLTLDWMTAPLILVQVLSVSTAMAVSILLAAALIHARGFGSYANVVFSSFVLTIFGQVLVVLAIVWAVLTGTENIYTAPEFSIPNDPGHIQHIIGHLTFGVGAGTLIGSAMGCLLLMLLRWLLPHPQEEPGR